MISFTNLRGDIYGGVTAAVVALPLALAFGVASGAGPIAGIYGAIFVGFFAALFGGTPAQISGPTGPMTVVMAATFTHYVSYDPVKGPMLAFTVVMLGGLLQILFGVLRLGKYINLVPFAVISGFMSGIGVIIIILQLGPLLGHASPPGGPLAALQALPDFFQTPVWTAVLLGMISLTIVFLLPARINRLFPAPLLALIIGTVLLLMFFPVGSVSVLGNIPTGIPVPQLPQFELTLLVDMLKSALVLAVLGSIDSLLTSLVADNMTRTYHHSDRELIGQGIGNTVAGLFGGLPGAGATMRTVVNIRAGGQTPVSGMLHALILLAIVLGAGALAEHIPHPVLAGILIKVGVDIIDWKFFKRLHHTTLASSALMFAVLFITVFVDLITAVAVGVIAASLLLVKRMADLQAESSKLFAQPDDELPLSSAEAELLQRAQGQIVIYHLTGPLSFGAAKDLVKRVSQYSDYKVLLLDFTNVPRVDFSIAKGIEDIIGDAINHDRCVCLIGIRPAVTKLLNKVGILDAVPREQQFLLRHDALVYAIATLDL